MEGAGDGVRLAELVAALSLATDLGLGQPQEHIIRWENQNEVVEARRPETMEFHTDGLVVWQSGKRTEARYEHRYEPEGTGSRVVYRLRQSAITNPPLRMRLPVMRTMTHRIMIAWFCRRGFTNLLRAAERRGSTTGVVQTPSSVDPQ
jgi:hypothetical protein